MAYTIEARSEENTNNITFPAIITSDYEGEVITVTTNGHSDSDCYTIMTDISWINIERNGGTVRIIPTTNTSNYTREGYIVFYNKGDKNVFTVVDVLQEKIEYVIKINGSSDKIEYGFDKPFETESIDFRIEVSGGRKSFYINAINEYSRDNARLVYDKAFKTRIRKIQDGDEENVYTLTVETHGIITPNTRYELILSHSNDRNITGTIVLTFPQDDYTVPIIQHKDYLYCETGIQNTETTSANSRISTFSRIMPLQYADTNQKEEKMWIESDGVTNPTVIDITDGEKRVKVYTEIYNNGKLETDSDIHVSISSDFCCVRYAKDEYTMEYKVIYLYPSRRINRKSERRCKVKITNKERLTQSYRLIARQKETGRKN